MNPGDDLLRKFILAQGNQTWTETPPSAGGISSSHQPGTIPPCGPADHQGEAAQLQLLIGIDVGGTKIAAGLLEYPTGRILGRKLTPTLYQRGGRAILDDCLRLARELAGEGEATGMPVAGIGLGVCELVDKGGNLASANCIPWLELPVREELAAIGPVVIEADVRAAAKAEALWGAGRGYDNFLYVTVGTGISCCLMIDGRPYLGARGITGSMGSSALRIPCQQCGAMQTRTLEEIAAGPALAARFAAHGGIAASGQEVFAAAAAGDAEAKRILRTASEALESQIGLVVNVVDPAAVIVGGGLGMSEGPYWEGFVAATRRNLWAAAHANLPILRAATGTDAGWLGAAACAARQ
ncbi:MAG: ROK family protein [Pirellulales bacterium]|nr:ROK family protein [Pirellulales bacterium]